VFRSILVVSSGALVSLQTPIAGMNANVCLTVKLPEVLEGLPTGQHDSLIMIIRQEFSRVRRH
jgi:hypothetical protein